MSRRKRDKMAHLPTICLITCLLNLLYSTIYSNRKNYVNFHHKYPFLYHFRICVSWLCVSPKIAKQNYLAIFVQIEF